ncbi:Ig-like domain-containing protein [Streptomyces sp. NPDC001393]
MHLPDEAVADGDRLHVAVPAAITVTPADGTCGAAFTSPVEVSVSVGTLASVRVTGDDGATLAGTFNAARTKWTS